MNERPTIPKEGVAKEMAEVMQACWRVDPSKRPTAKQIRDAVELLIPQDTNNNTRLSVASILSIESEE